MDSSLRRERLAGLILCATAPPLPTLAIYAPLAITLLLIVVAVAMLVLVGHRCTATLRRLWPLIALLAALGFWTLLSTLWSIIPAHSVIEALRFLGISALGLVLLAAALSTPVAARDRIGHGLV